MTRDHPLSRLVTVASLPASGLVVPVTPTEAERAALAAFNGLVAIPALAATLMLRPEGRDGVLVTGELVGTVTTTCVVSLEPFDAPLHESVEVHFLSAEALAVFRARQSGRPSDDDENPPEEPDAIENGQIDLGLLVSEHLTLGLDPYPRKPDATLAAEWPAGGEAASPFAVLRAFGEKPS